MVLTVDCGVLNGFPAPLGRAGRFGAHSGEPEHPQALRAGWLAEDRPKWTLSRQQVGLQLARLGWLLLLARLTRSTMPDLG